LHEYINVNIKLGKYVRWTLEKQLSTVTNSRNYFQALSMENLIDQLAQLKPFFTSSCHKSIPKQLRYTRSGLSFEVISISIVQYLFNLFMFRDYQLCFTTFPSNEILFTNHIYMVNKISYLHARSFQSRREF
jgi:hypothetical protein